MHVAGSYRKVMASPRHMRWEWLDRYSLRLRFTLEPSCYATVLLGELTGGGVASLAPDQSDVNDDDDVDDAAQLD